LVEAEDGTADVLAELEAEAEEEEEEERGGR
jgi:hypothetical protein